MCQNFCNGLLQHYGWSSGAEKPHRGVIGGRPGWIPPILTERVQETIAQMLLTKDHTVLASSIDLDSDIREKARWIALKFCEQTGVEVNMGMLYFMARAHDDRYSTTDNSSTGTSLCEEDGMPCDIARIRNIIGFLEGNWFPDPFGVVENIADYIYNRNFYNAWLSGNRCEPKSIEWQIVRLANHTSADMSSTVHRYWQKGKRLWTPYFLKDVSFEERVGFSFPKMEEYKSRGKVDELTFFLAFLSLSPADFQHPALREIYAGWAKDKDKAIVTILEIADEYEGLSYEDVKEMENTINRYVRYFDLSW